MLQDDITSALMAQGAAGEQGIIERTISALIEGVKAIFRLIFAPFRMILDSLTGGAPETPPPPPEPTAQPPYMLIAVFIIAVIAVITFIHFHRELKKDENGTYADIADPGEEPEPEDDQQDPEEPEAADLDNFSTETPTLNEPKIPPNEDETEPDKGNAAEPENEPEKKDRYLSDSALKEALEAYAASGAIESMSFADWIKQEGERRNE